MEQKNMRRAKISGCKGKAIPQPKLRRKKFLFFVPVLAAGALALATGIPHMCSSQKGNSPESSPATRRDIPAQAGKQSASNPKKRLEFLINSRKQLRQLKERAATAAREQEFESWKDSLPGKTLPELVLDWSGYSWELMHRMLNSRNGLRCEDGGSLGYRARKLALEEEISWRQEGEGIQQYNQARKEPAGESRLPMMEDSELRLHLIGEIRVICGVIEYYSTASALKNKEAKTDAIEELNAAFWRVDALLNEANARACKRAQERESGNPGQ